jgi:hypothetical protein
MRRGSTFSETETRPAGHIFFIPGTERPTDDTKNRPHFLVNRCDPVADPYVLGTLAHMSTKATEIHEYGCAGYEIVDPTQLKGDGRDGNFVITARLLPRSATRLTRSHHSATDSVRSVRTSVLQAAGVGEGVGKEGSGSVRGRLARVLDRRAGFEHGVILTAHEYSRQRRYQVIVPIIDRVTEDGMEELELTPWDVLLKRRMWIDHLRYAEPLLETAGLISLTEEWKRSRDSRKWLKKQIEVTHAVIDAPTLAEVESKIGERLRQ